MINLFTKIIMILSFLYYGALLTGFWLSALMGWHNEVWEAYDFPRQDLAPPSWLLAMALAVTILAFSFLGYAYRAVWKILNGGAGQDFRLLARHLQDLAIGLVGFWGGYNIINGALRFLLAAHLPASVAKGVEVGWDFLDIDIIYLILPAAIYAVSRTLERAWQAEEEVQSFL